MKTSVLVLDIGTTTIKAFVFDKEMRVLGQAKAKPSKSRPQTGWVEQDPLEIITLAKQVLKEVVQTAKVKPADIASFGITNQRETVIAWDSKTGKPLYPAIVWEDTRTRDACTGLKQYSKDIVAKTGLPIDPYFSATKINWLLQQPEVAKSLKNKTLLVGTIDSWALWNLSANNTHATDYTNASRTLLFNIKTLEWDAELMKLFSVPTSILPKALPSTSDFGVLEKKIIGAELPIRALCGDQQASQFASGVSVGTTKVTFGTGIFISQSIGSEFQIRPPFFTTLIPNDKQPWYALEAKINESGERVQELLNINADLSPLLREFSMEVNHYVRQLPVKPFELIVDGGITQAPKLVQILSEVTGIPVRTQTIPDGTPLGVAKLLFLLS
jgi:glycerol kinase